MKRDLPPEAPARLDLLRRFLIFEDRKILAFNKPAGMASQGGSNITRDLESELALFVDGKGRQPHLAHRLDVETSGVIVAGRTPRALSFLNAQFAARNARKTYLAIVCGGAPDPVDGRIETALVKIKTRGLDLMRPATARDATSLTAVTAYRTLAHAPQAALVELKPETGRMHQLRVHLASIGRPIAADRKYGGLSSLAHGGGAVRVDSLALHASALHLPHPDGGDLHLEATPPDAFQHAAQQLGLAEALKIAYA